MHFDRRLVKISVLLVCLLLMGINLNECRDRVSDDGDTSRGTADIRISVRDSDKISDRFGNFEGNLDRGDQFGSAVSNLGDLEADGVQDLAVGAPFDNDDGDDRGAVWVLFMDDDGSVDTESKISGEDGGFDGDLDNNDFFGSSVAGIGDLNRDGALDLAVGAPEHDDGRGAVWILFLNAQGEVRLERKIADDTGGFDGDLDDDDGFGSAVDAIGDVNGDGITDLAVGTPNDDDGPNNAGAVWILFMTSEGTVRDTQKISADSGGFDGDLDAEDRFGAAVAGIGDIDDNGVPDLAVGSPGNDDGGPDRGAVWILFLNDEGRVRDEQRISDGTGGFGGTLDNDDRFGTAVAISDDQDSDGTWDLAVGAPNDDDGSEDAGAVWILVLDEDGRVNAWQKISSTSGGFGGNLDAEDRFGSAVDGIGNLDDSGGDDLAVGAPGDDDQGTDKGAIWILFMRRDD